MGKRVGVRGRKRICGIGSDSGSEKSGRGSGIMRGEE